MNEELENVYRLMVKSRLFEVAVKKLWDEGKIHGEMHMGVGEEAIIAAVVSQLIDGDAMATDHRGTPPFLMRGVDPVEILLEFLAHEQGLCGGWGGHMHLFSKEHLASSSGIVGSAGPAGAGYALTLQYKKTNNLAVSFFGEGSMNQGMLMESLNLASAWNLPQLFICKNNSWAITTKSQSVTGGDLVERARSFGIPAVEVDGTDAEVMLGVVKIAMDHIRKKGGPYFIMANCIHSEGHFLGDPLFRFHDQAIKEFKEVTPDLMKAMVKKGGASLFKRAGSMKKVLGLIAGSKSQTKKKLDPLLVFEKKFKSEKEKIKSIQEEISQEITGVVQKSLEIFEGGVA